MINKQIGNHRSVMYSNRDMESVSSQDMEGVDNSKDLEESKSIELDIYTNPFTMPSKTTNSDLKEVEEFSATIATQTSLTLIKFTLIQALPDKQFIEPTTSAMHNNRKSGDKMKEHCENTKSLSCMIIQNQPSMTISRELATSANSSYPLLMRSRSRMSRDAVHQVSTPFVSSKSGFKNEILTVTTDYGSSSTDTCSTLIATVNQNGNEAAHLSVQDTYRVPHRILQWPLPTSLSLPNVDSTRNNSFRRRTNHPSRNIMESLNNCLRCIYTVDNEPDTHPHVRDAPPAYSTTYANHRRRPRDWRLFRIRNGSSFMAPTPPPSYIQAQEIYLASYSVDDLFSTSLNANRNRAWSSRPMTTICSRCTSIIVTTIEVRQSISTHITAFVLFLCGCWPCCMIPYCMNSCKTIDHHCPICRAYLGTYRPW